MSIYKEIKKQKGGKGKDKWKKRNKNNMIRNWVVTIVGFIFLNIFWLIPSVYWFSKGHRLKLG